MEEQFRENRVAVLWHRLITEADEISQLYGLGLGNVWEWINRNDYDKAREQLDRVQNDCRAGRWKINTDNKYMKAHMHRITAQLRTREQMTGTN